MEWNGMERNGKESKEKQRKGKPFDHALGTENKSGYTLTSISPQFMGNCIPPLPLISRTKNGIKGLEKTKEKKRKQPPFFGPKKSGIK